MKKEKQEQKDFRLERVKIEQICWYLKKRHDKVWEILDVFPTKESAIKNIKKHNIQNIEDIEIRE